MRKVKNVDDMSNIKEKWLKYMGSVGKYVIFRNEDAFFAVNHRLLYGLGVDVG